jgi:hypothetical protein
MSKIAGISDPANELELLIADLSGSGPLIFVFGVGWWTAHLTGATAPVFRGPGRPALVARRPRRGHQVDRGTLLARPPELSAKVASSSSAR